MAAASRLLNGLLRSRRLSSSSFTAILRPLSPSPTHGPLGAFLLPPPSVRTFATCSIDGDVDDFRSDALGLPTVLLNDADVGSSFGDSFLPVKLAVSILDSYHDLTGLPWWISDEPTQNRAILCIQSGIKTPDCCVMERGSAWKKNNQTAGIDRRQLLSM